MCVSGVAGAEAPGRRQEGPGSPSGLGREGLLSSAEKLGSAAAAVRGHLVLALLLQGVLSEES